MPKQLARRFWRREDGEVGVVVLDYWIGQRMEGVVESGREDWGEDVEREGEVVSYSLLLQLEEGIVVDWFLWSLIPHHWESLPPSEESFALFFIQE